MGCGVHGRALRRYVTGSSPRVKGPRRTNGLSRSIRLATLRSGQPWPGSRLDVLSPPKPYAQSVIPDPRASRDKIIIKIQLAILSYTAATPRPP